LDNVDLENALQNKKDQIEDLKISIKNLEESSSLEAIVNDNKKNQELKKLRDKKSDIEDFKLELEKTIINDAYDLDNKKKSIEEQEISLAELERNLKDLLDDNSNQELIFVQNEVKQARINLENEVKKLEQYELGAPFDGIITKLDYQV
jgi:multidrug resistance efflux pump